MAHCVISRYGIFQSATGSHISQGAVWRPRTAVGCEARNTPCHVPLRGKVPENGLGVAWRMFLQSAPLQFYKLQNSIVLNSLRLKDVLGEYSGYMAS